MERIEKLLADPMYRLYLAENEKWEQRRRFCKHGPDHFWHTARVAYILYLEGRGEGFAPGDSAKEMIYAAALLHDIGRFREYEDQALDHAAQSAILARPLLLKAGFPAMEAEMICEAVANHRELGHSGLSWLLYTADKASRPCATCPALGDCKKFPNGKKPKARY